MPKFEIKRMRFERFVVNDFTHIGGDPHVFSKQTYKLTIIVVSNVGGIVTPTIYVGTIGEATVLL